MRLYKLMWDLVIYWDFQNIYELQCIYMDLSITVMISFLSILFCVFSCKRHILILAVGGFEFCYPENSKRVYCIMYPSFWWLRLSVQAWVMKKTYICHSVNKDALHLESINCTTTILYQCSWLHPTLPRPMRWQWQAVVRGEDICCHSCPVAKMNERY